MRRTLAVVALAAVAAYCLLPVGWDKHLAHIVWAIFYPFRG